MKRLIFIVEGETELEFVNRLLIPFLVSKGLNTSMQAVLITIGGGGHGFNNIEHFKNTIKPFLYEKDPPVITTMIDHYGINSEKKLPGFCKCSEKQTTESRISCLEEALTEAVSSIKHFPLFIPYIQRHELETLLFVNPKDGFDLESKGIKDDVIKLCSDFDNIEDINCTPQGAPSKRLERIYKLNGSTYNKVSDAVDIIELGGSFDLILRKCPHFKEWIDKLLSAFQIY